MDEMDGKLLQTAASSDVPFRGTSSLAGNGELKIEDPTSWPAASSKSVALEPRFQDPNLVTRCPGDRIGVMDPHNPALYMG